MGCYGSRWAHTPNLDKLASSSYIFENAYVTQAVCTPARASIMTGLYPHTAGPIVNKLCLPMLFIDQLNHQTLVLVAVIAYGTAVCHSVGGFAGGLLLTIGLAPILLSLIHI